MFWLRIRKLFFSHALLSGGLLLSCNFAGPDLGINCMQKLPVDETIVDMHYFAGPDLVLNCMYLILSS